jgi:hypothetical protein
MASAEGRAAIYDRRLDPARKEIRLLTVLPPAGDEDNTSDIYSELETVTLTSDLEFIAISYVWGDPEDTFDIFVNDIAFGVTVNLGAALWHFRRYGLLREVPDGKPLRLWVDAVCINQVDLEERAQQVIFMKEIYSGARHVFSWLGAPDGKDIDLAIDTIRDVISTLRVRVRDYAAARRSDYEVGERAFSDDGYDGDEDDSTSYSHSRSGSPTESIYCQSPNSIEAAARLSTFSGHASESDRGSESEDRSEAAGERGTNGRQYFVQQFISVLKEREELCRENGPWPLYNRAWNSIRNLHYSEYWKRIWVYQEMALADATYDCHYLFCGRSHVTMADVELFAQLSEDLAELPRTTVGIYHNVWLPLKTELLSNIALDAWAVKQLRRVKLDPKNSGYFWTIDRSVTCSASDPRDMIYGLSGILGLSIIPDYDKPAKDVYLDWCALVYSSFSHNRYGLHRFLSDLFRYSGLRESIPEDLVPGLPSWCPPLHRMPVGGKWRPQRFAVYHPDEPIFSAEDFHIPSKGVMRVFGVMCGSIKSTRSSDAGNFEDPKDRLAEYFDFLSEIIEEHKIEHEETTYKTGCSFEQAVVLAAFCGVRPQNYMSLEEHEWPLFWRLLQHCATNQFSAEEYNMLLYSLSYSAEHDSYLHKSREATEGDQSEDTVGLARRRSLGKAAEHEILSMVAHFLIQHWPSVFIELSTGYVGLASASVRATDQVCAVNGCSFPVILRKQDDRWVYIGSCYVYGISYVDMSEFVSRNELEGQWIDIY